MKRFEGRRLFIATKHEKERVIAPLLEQELGVVCFSDPNYDTDRFGTFSGEVERLDDPLETLRKKCLAGMEHSRCDLVVASEGSFGMHPSLFFTAADDEFILLMDAQEGLEIVARELSTQTNFNSREVETFEELLDFAAAAGFPEHGLILRPSAEARHDLHKGITCAKDLRRCFDELQLRFGAVHVETDMRALFNPTRMQVIEQATLKLVEKIKSACPSCGTPGFGITEGRSGLLCNLCGTPTASLKSHLYVCQRCAYEQERLYPHGKTTEDPMYCPNCNP